MTLLFPRSLGWDASPRGIFADFGTEPSRPVYPRSRMSLRRLALALLAAALAAWGAALPAEAKEDVRARLTTAIPMGAAPGTKIEVAWKLFYVAQDGRRRPFGASGVFVRLVSASGGEATEAFSYDQGGPGEYEATAVVPEGGIGDVEIGLMGWQSDATGTRRADMLFPIANEPSRIAPIASPTSERPPPPPERRAAGSSAWTVVPLASAAAALAALAGTVVLLRRRRGALERGA
jgi:hypothetical protein